MYTIIVTGADGQLAQCIKENLKVKVNNNINYIFLNRKEMDITNKNNILEIFEKYNPKIVVNCAAYTNVDKAENEDYEVACKINIDGVENLAFFCKAKNCLLLHISTDYVYDGNLNYPYVDNSACVPQNVYGRTKLYGDEKIKFSGCNYLIFRVSWLYSNKGKNFYNKIIEKIVKKDKTIYSSIDEISSPTNANYFAKAIIAINEKYCNNDINEQLLNNIYHYSDLGLCSRYDFAISIQDFVHNYTYISEYASIIACNKNIFKTNAKRPYYTVLDCKKTKEAFPFIEFNYWRDNLEKEIKKYFE